MTVETMLLVLVLLAGFYMAWNIGANDVANAIGTSVGSGALSLRKAVIMAAILEFVGAFFFGSYVSGTIQSGIVDPHIFTADPAIFVYGMLASLLAAGLWLQVASYYGWPVSTTHTIVGAVIGFGAIVGGVEAVYWDQVSYIVFSWILSPLFGGIIAFAIFNFLRTQIFYSNDPIKAAKKLTPPIVFVVTTLLSMLLIFNGLKNIELHFSFTDAFWISLSLASLCSLFSYRLVKRLPSRKEAISTDYNPDLIRGLDKARKHLRRVQASCAQQEVLEVTHLIEEVERLQRQQKEKHVPEQVKSEFAIVERIFGYLQVMSAGIMAFAHGANDVANAIGPLAAAITVIQTSAIPTTLAVPTWTLALGGAGIVLGLATWGWRVVETIGRKITELTPTRGFAAELAAAATTVIASRLGLPISTTHTLVGAVIGVGLARGIEALDLSKTRDIVISWLITVPAGASLAVLFYYLIDAVLPR